MKKLALCLLTAATLSGCSSLPSSRPAYLPSAAILPTPYTFSREEEQALKSAASRWQQRDRSLYEIERQTQKQQQDNLVAKKTFLQLSADL